MDRVALKLGFKNFLKNYFSLKVYTKFYHLKINFFSKGGYGVRGLDLKLIKIINPEKNKGFYIELGANDGIRQSNTYLLQKIYKWKGLLIEPSPIKFRECLENRSFFPKAYIFCAACVDYKFKNKFILMEDSDLMSIAKGLDIDNKLVNKHADSGKIFLENEEHRISYGANAKTLTSLLKDCNAPSKIDFLSIDVEGNELSVLNGLNFNSFRPLWILVEVRPENEIEIKNLLRTHNYNEEIILSDNKSYKDILFKKREEGIIT